MGKTAELRKLDAFHHRCLRRIAGIAPSYYSRVSNTSVWNMLEAKSLKQVLLSRQLVYLGNIAGKTSNNALREYLFNPGEVTLRPIVGRRRKGRPRACWAKHLYRISLEIAGDEAGLSRFWAGTVTAKSAWKRAVDIHCNEIQ